MSSMSFLWFFSGRAGTHTGVLVLAPTRKLAKKVEKEINESAPYLNTICDYGGVSSVTLQNALSRGVDFVVGTPGRTNDLLKVNSLKLGGLYIWSLIKLIMCFRLYLKRVLEVILGTLHSSGRACFSLQQCLPGLKKWQGNIRTILCRLIWNNPVSFLLFLFLFLLSCS